MIDICHRVALSIRPKTNYETARTRLEAELSPEQIKEIDKNIDVQSMLTMNDPNVHAVKQRMLPSRTFKHCFRMFKTYDWGNEFEFRVRFGRRTYNFPSRTAYALFYYHPEIVSVWKKLPGAPRGFDTSNIAWKFFEEKQEEQFSLDSLNHLKLPEGFLWADACSTSSDED